MIIRNGKKYYTIEEAMEISRKRTREYAEEFVKLVMERQTKNDKLIFNN